MSNPPPSGSGAWAKADPAAYRPLNVRDALSYLDQVKIQFADQPEVYNRFLDVMKEFKGQVIDTPGVIDRVSTLFRGHPSLIQGFNTFLPPGYRIECFGPEGDAHGVITVTTPTGTVSQVPGGGGLAAAMERNEREREMAHLAAQQSEREMPGHPGYSGAPPPQPHPYGREAPRAEPLVSRAQPPLPPQPAAAPRPPPPSSVPMPPQHPMPASGPSTPGAGPYQPGQPQQSAAQQQRGTPMLEFNHAISFVNKIKNRFNSEPETYKNFLEILQTYHRDQRIEEVYEQVIELFKNAPDLLAEFKQFLPESGGGLGFGSFVQAAAGSTAPTAGQKRKDTKDPAATKKRRQDKAAAQKKKKEASPEADEPTVGSQALQTLASPEEVAFFDKVKKYIDDKVTYHEFLKLLNLFTQDIVDAKTLLERAKLFIGDAGDIWTSFKKMVGADDVGNSNINHATQAQGGFGFGGMVNIDNRMSENTPMLERVKPDFSTSRAKAYGPSYRKLPTTEINLNCTGRDAMCWEVLNDEWASHPTWAAEDAAPFLAHRKNAYEEALHKSEEERHEYDFHIEANLRTIALLEPLYNKIQSMDEEERRHFNLKSGLGGHSRSIYQRILKKVYGKELGPDIIKALHENPVIALPIVLERLKAKDDEWKKAQREWNRVWREQDAKNFYKALDHQGVTFKSQDKKTIAPKTIIAEIEARRREQVNARNAMAQPGAQPRPRHQYAFEFKDVEVLKDALKLVFGFLDRMATINQNDKERIEQQLRDFIPTFFMFDKEEFDDFGDAADSDESSESDGDQGMGEDNGRTRKGQPSLRQKLLKEAAAKNREDTGTPAPGDAQSDGTDNADMAVDDEDKVSEDPTWAPFLESEEQANLDAGPQPKRQRAANFFANNHFFILVRLIQILYSRLLLCKTIAADLAAQKKQPINPEAIKLGLAEPETQNLGVENGENPARHYYDHLLALCERLFDQDIDQATFEETLRLMFSNKAYIMFTVDRLVSAIVKQTQQIVGDNKSQELLKLLVADRRHERTTTRQQVAYRMKAESVLGPEETRENMYRIEYVPRTETVAVQLIKTEDLTVDAKNAVESWNFYMSSYPLIYPTEGLPHRVEQPFLKRTLQDLPADGTVFSESSGLKFRVALGNYRLFYVPGTEDYFHRASGEEEEPNHDAAKKRLDEWVQSKLDEPEDEEEAEPADVAAAAAAPAAQVTDE
ncbi:hypothetical protein CC85DRAFT_285843 [Cutaneotrichosporon oleaginosum]|uniref:Histone deacetylase interacting domain-containing protein n=1 Tax=Cutaneotrichosporon oleaginosum TaxID=879819 RepID=A0A0J1B376_9TREE|nr:uncharacterized protein CC85DRAFT_285843 [Cutaneotrichosporon oleaginosum]KLT42069.1 hypothetical protein CC85DRAFT_285843 [Cutaneotrichosporon oleaginosum]TXT04692.1 hypothetical protein COLE_07511 [Cutaneotrichosporon oleaginosum]